MIGFHVRSRAHNGPKSDIAPCPKGANSRHDKGSREAASLALSDRAFESDYASLWIGVKVHLLAVLDAFAFIDRHRRRVR
jgi:hypothetical protein